MGRTVSTPPEQRVRSSTSAGVLQYADCRAFLWRVMSLDLGSQCGCTNRMQAEARKLAFYLFWNVKGDMGRNHVLLEDLEHFLQPDLAEQAFAMLDRDGNGKVTLHVRASTPCDVQSDFTAWAFGDPVSVGALACLPRGHG